MGCVSDGSSITQSLLPLHGAPCGGVVTMGSSIMQSEPPVHKRLVRMDGAA